MKFIYAKQLKTKFLCFGHFYEFRAGRKKYRCRNVLENCRRGHDCENCVPDAIIVMMNPGSSSPSDSSELPLVTLSTIPSMQVALIKAKPDTTQYQVMRLMLLLKWNHVRIINLSDLCGGESAEFLRKHKILSKDPNAAFLSLFSKGRSRERTKFMKKKADGCLFVAWGVDRGLIPLVEQYHKSCSNKVKVGLPHSVNPDGYLHPSPSKKVDKIKWLKAAKKLLTR